MVCQEFDFMGMNIAVISSAEKNCLMMILK